MMDASQIREHMNVVGSNGQHIGTVDRVEGSRIKLTKDDSSDGEHRYVEMSDVDEIKNGEVCVSGKASGQMSNATKAGKDRSQKM